MVSGGLTRSIEIPSARMDHIRSIRVGSALIGTLINLRPEKPWVKNFSPIEGIRYTSCSQSLGGVNGEFSLAQRPEAISIAEIITALEGPMRPHRVQCRCSWEVAAGASLSRQEQLAGDGYWGANTQKTRLRTVDGLSATDFTRVPQCMRNRATIKSTPIGRSSHQRKLFAFQRVLKRSHLLTEFPVPLILNTQQGERRQERTAAALPVRSCSLALGKVLESGAPVIRSRERKENTT
jgi:hypothetical protein